MVDIITVAALNAYVRSVLESDAVLTDIAIRGEISNFSRHFKTGHCYFSLKDEKAAVKAVLFKGDAARLSFQPENGMRVVVRGRISLYERDGAFQIYVDAMFPEGLGSVQMAFDQLKARLQAEGLFAPEHKRQLPEYPAVVGLVTSQTGAALQDILKVAQLRCPTARFLLAPVSVQGDAAAAGIAAAVRALDKSGRVDVIIIARGGGSAEDLWVFNSEKIARAVFACGVPVVSAIGHEVDFTILDFVADLRAPTPSAAAELVLPDLFEKQQAMLHIYANTRNIMHHRLDSWYNSTSAGIRDARRTGPQSRIPPRQQAVGQMAALAKAAAGQTMQQNRQRLQAGAALAQTLNPYSVLARGYALVSQDGHAVASIQAVKTKVEVLVRLQDGSLSCTVDAIQPLPVADAAEKKR